ncbi:MAG: hypothetical protein MRJ92_07670 [Nitrospira sp.]|nr:hypothetical protein [Nitrospira sp.]
MYLILLPILIGGFSFLTMKPSVDEPIESRARCICAPPASTKVHGKTHTFKLSQNPYRVNLEGKYDQAYSNKLIVETGMAV